MKLALWLLPLTLLLHAEPKIKLPTSRADLAQGQKLFEVQCALCHGLNGEGGRGPLLAQLKLWRAPDDAALFHVIHDGVPGTEMPGADAMSDHEVLQVAAFVRSLGRVAAKPVAAKPVTGDAKNGEEIFRGKGGCLACHAIHGAGGIGGPDLASIGLARSAPFLRQALLDPAKSIPDGYLLVTVTPRTGAPVTGVRLNEDSFSIQIRGMSGAMRSFLKSDIDDIDRKKGETPMPSFKDKLSDAELTNLVAYLASLRETK
jgi:cytochrome c oxidase cbb3-type subunit III